MADIVSLDPNETIHNDGSRFYAHEDINVCRDWLRRAGLEVKTCQGWVSKNRAGWIAFSTTEEKWHAGHFPR